MPGFLVAGDVDRAAVGEGLGVEVGDGGAGRSLDDAAVGIAKRDPRYVSWILRSAAQKMRHELLERELALAPHHHVGSTGEILLVVAVRLRPSQHHDGAVFLGKTRHGEDVPPRPQIARDADDRRLLLGEQTGEVGGAAERRVENLDIDAALLEVRREIQDS